jgi:putative thioredoxin
MIDITLQNFEAELIQGSMSQPILLDIWAPWCSPCRTLGPVLEKLETAYGGRFRLAKLNSDEQPEIAGQLSQAFGVRSIPFCVLFAGGQPVDGFVGALPEAQVREFLDRHVPTEQALEAEADLAEADALEAQGDTAAALARLQQAVAVDPANDTARYDYTKLLLETGQVALARQTFEPVATKVALDARLAAAGHWLAACERAPHARTMPDLDAAIAANRRDFDARFERAQVLLAASRFTDAMDELLEIVMRDKPAQPAAAGADVRGAVLHHDPPADEEAEGAQGHDRGAGQGRRGGHRRRRAGPRGQARRQPTCTSKWPTASSCRCSGPSVSRCCPRAPSSKPSARRGRPWPPKPALLECARHLEVAGPPKEPMNRYPWWKYAMLAVALVIGSALHAAQLLRRGAGRAGVQRQGHRQGRRRDGAARAAGAEAGRPDQARLRAVRRQLGQGALRRHRHPDQGQGRHRQGAEPRSGRPELHRRAEPAVALAGLAGAACARCRCTWAWTCAAACTS